MKTYYCTHCGKRLDEISIELSIYLLTERNTLDGWESINNSQVINSERVCRECFETFIEKVNQFKKDA